MTYKQEDTIFDQAMELLIENGFDEVAIPIGIMMNAAMKIERSRFLKAAPYERTQQREGYANGFKDKTVRTRVGSIHLKVPQTRDCDFYPSSLERGLRSERALKLALADMYVQGVSTRKVAKITETLCGFEVSSAEVSRASQELDEQLDMWRKRQLEAYSYVYLDARYENIRTGGIVTGCAVLIAIGVSESGHREVLGVSVALSEAEVHWRDFISSLKDRGLHGVKLFISDAHEGLKAARTAVFPTVPWQRCQFHLQQNAGSYIPRKSMKKPVAARIRGVFNAPDDTEALRLLQLFIDDYTKTAPELAAWAEKAIPEGLVVFQMPEEHRLRIRTSNMLERLNREVNRRTSVVGIFPNIKSCLRLVTAITMEKSDEWATGKIYLNMNIKNAHNESTP